MNGTVAERLTSLMNAQEIGAGRLAALSRVDVRLIRKYRNGQVQPRNAWGSPTDNAYKIARALGVDVHELVPPLTKRAA